jgi:rhodanese-related sulfurtransferase
MADPAVKRVDPPAAANILKQTAGALLIDVRSRVEFDYVGHPIGAIHVPWKDAPDWQTNPHFVKQVRQLLRDVGRASPEDTPILLICRSGGRSLAAGEALAADGFRELYNVEEGFEGDRDADNHRGTVNGWRYHGLPWEQT